MSAFSDWRCGAISYEEYRQEAAYEARRDEYLSEQKEWEYEESEEDEE